MHSPHSPGVESPIKKGEVDSYEDVAEAQHFTEKDILGMMLAEPI